MHRTRPAGPRKPRRIRLQVEQLEARNVLAPTTALNDLGTGLYMGSEGGLYPNGTDMRPPAVETNAENIASQITPLDMNGNPDPVNGKVVMISIGMSITHLDFNSGPDSFEPRAQADPATNSKLVIVDGAQSGQTIEKWTDPNAGTWKVVDGRLGLAGVVPKQVQVVWLKQIEGTPARLGSFPTWAQTFQRDLETVARNIKTRYPNAKIAYVSSRSHAFTSNPSTASPEPYDFESGYSVKWMIQDQINGTGNLNWNASQGTVVAPFLSWGPYLWANGSTPRSDGFQWVRSDYQADATHPTPSGVHKVADQLLAFFKTDPTATGWYLKPTPAGQGPTVIASANVTSGASGLTVNFTASATAVTGSISQYVWTFDDGDFSYNQNPTKTFYGPGTYHVHLNVFDSSGNWTETTLPITISSGTSPAESVAELPSATTPPSWLARYVTDTGVATPKAIVSMPAVAQSKQVLPVNGAPAANNAPPKTADGASAPATTEEWEGLKDVFGEL
jgi:PKD repeat protein